PDLMSLVMLGLVPPPTSRGGGTIVCPLVGCGNNVRRARQGTGLAHAPRATRFAASIYAMRLQSVGNITPTIESETFGERRTLRQ
ncbi:MAG TPA: hypothetical protein VGJ20_30500, partial [Xanthobacteraceae bacterium]